MELTNETLDNAIDVYETTLAVCDNGLLADEDYNPMLDRCTLSFLKELKEYRKMEEQDLLLKLPISIESAVDKLFSHNEIISLWRKVKENGVSFHKRIWYGMAWDIPKELKSCKFVKIFGTIPESIAHADIVNIEVLLSAEAEQSDWNDNYNVPIKRAIDIVKEEGGLND